MHNDHHVLSWNKSAWWSWHAVFMMVGARWQGQGEGEGGTRPSAHGACMSGKARASDGPWTMCGRAGWIVCIRRVLVASVHVGRVVVMTLWRLGGHNCRIVVVAMSLL